MIVAHNLTAMNVSRNFSVSSTKKGKYTEKLSSGYRINRAADDAAGLTISEKMRSQIRGLDQASENAQSGISLVQTVDGALEEVQSMIHRMKELSIKAANGTNTQDDKEAIQKELDELVKEIDRVAYSTEFNTMHLLDGSLNNGDYVFGRGGRPYGVMGAEKSDGDGLSAVYGFTTSQVPVGGDTSAGHAKLAEELEKQIVPQIVDSIMNQYSAFSYLSGSTIGIGLRLYSQSSSTMAYVSSSYREEGAGTANVKGSKEYQLGVNLSHLSFQADGSLTAGSRQELEATIAHEMVHAFMAEATTNGMLGSDRFPLWFVEGMAQTASGDGGWTSSLNAASSDADIRSFLTRIGPGYSRGDGVANYGTGYLASMYLGYMAGTGGTMEDRITDGLNKIMSTVIGGSSLHDAIAAHTKYSGLADFSNNLRNDADAYDFVRDLMSATGAGRGGLVTGDLTDTDLADDAALAGINVFKLYPNKEKVQNIYSGNYVVLSGGGARSPEPPPGTSSGGGLAAGIQGSLIIQTGARQGDIMEINIPGATAGDLGLEYISVMTKESAGWAMEACDLALARVSENRSNMGAYQNRLEHAIANLDNTSENIQAAESRIRDADMAEEMVAYSGNNILVQTAQSLLAQANQSRQGILTLLG